MRDNKTYLTLRTSRTNDYSLSGEKKLIETELYATKTKILPTITTILEKDKRVILIRFPLQEGDGGISLSCFPYSVFLLSPILYDYISFGKICITLYLIVYQWSCECNDSNLTCPMLVHAYNTSPSEDEYPNYNTYVLPTFMVQR